MRRVPTSGRRPSLKPADSGLVIQFLILFFARIETMQRVLNVGGNNKNIALPSCYMGWKQTLLDIDPRGEPDIVLDARELSRVPPCEYDAVYCSHNLEHYYRHDGSKVLAGFFH